MVIEKETLYYLYIFMPTLPKFTVRNGRITPQKGLILKEKHSQQNLYNKLIIYYYQYVLRIYSDHFVHTAIYNEAQ